MHSPTESPMILAALDYFDFLIIAVMIIIFAGGTTVATRRSTSDAAAGERLRRMEDKLNLLLTHNGIDYVPRTKERWQRLAESNDKASAAEEYSETHSIPLEEAEEVVNQYLADISTSH
jgi:hypothetical protein